MTVAAAALTLLLDVRDFAAGRHLAVAPEDASTGERREAEKPNEPHDDPPQVHRSAAASPVPMRTRALSDACCIYYRCGKEKTMGRDEKFLSRARFIFSRLDI